MGSWRWNDFVILQLKINFLFIMKGEFKKGFSLLKFYRNDGGMR
jgi:hypothetical protein